MIELNDAETYPLRGVRSRLVRLSIVILNRIEDKIEVFSVHKESRFIILLLPGILGNSINIFTIGTACLSSASVLSSVSLDIYA